MINIDKTETTLKYYNEQIASTNGNLSGRLVLKIVKDKKGDYLEVDRMSMLKSFFQRLKNFFGFDDDVRLNSVFTFIRKNKSELDKLPSYEVFTNRLNQKATSHNKKFINILSKIQLFTDDEKSFAKPKGAAQSPPQPSPTPNPSPAPNPKKSNQPSPQSSTPNPVPTSNANPNPIPQANIIPGLVVNGVENPNVTISSTPKPVGALGDKWKFESDHIPVGAEIKIGQMKANFALFNVLNSSFMSFINSDGQGLAGSDITQTESHPGEFELRLNEFTYLAAGGADHSITRRHQHISHHILNMIAPQSKDGGENDFLLLPECGKPFINRLIKVLPSYFQLIPVNSEGVDTQVYLVNTKKFNVEGTVKRTEFTEMRNNTGGLTAETNKFISEIMLSTKPENGPVQKLRVVGTHLPGAPQNINNAKLQLGRYLANNMDDIIPTVVMGDMNSTTQEVKNYIDMAYSNVMGVSPFVPVTQGTRSHIGTNKEAIDYDSIFVASGNARVIIRERKPKEVLPKLPDEVVQILS